MRNEEAGIQKVVVFYVRKQFPNILFTCAPAVAKSARQGHENKMMGYLKGFPDLFFAVPRKGYNGLFIELKTKSGRVQPEQEEIVQKLNDLGYKALICRGADFAIEAINNYLK